MAGAAPALIALNARSGYGERIRAKAALLHALKTGFLSPVFRGWTCIYTPVGLKKGLFKALFREGLNCSDSYELE